jgi:CRISPR-associated endonuclease Cas1
MAEANFLLRKKQFGHSRGSIEIARLLIINKSINQKELLRRTREKSVKIDQACKFIEACIPHMEGVEDYRALMGLEGKIARLFFQAYFEFAGWNTRLPRVKCDPLNATLDIGYTMMFNYLESMTRLFGFDPYMGVYHQLWFRRKSLICDLMEPFRCIIDHQIHKSLKYGTFKSEHFELLRNAYYLKSEYRKIYTEVFFRAIIEHKNEIYKFIQQYYRCFMSDRPINQYPRFHYE